MGSQDATANRRSEAGRGPWSGVSSSRTTIMRANRRRDTGPEVALRSCLYARGVRYRVDYAIRLDGSRPIRADIALPGRRVAIFVDGCFWHSCPEHGTSPKSNRGYWIPKLESNRLRDTRHTLALRSEGWTVIRIWEHDDPSDAADALVAMLRAVTRVVSSD